jgi:formamidopyrimidine-DNA glycosylase
MIELPEIETIRRDLDKDCSGKKVKNIEIKIARIAGGANLKNAIENSFDQMKVLSVRRIGMLICIDFANEMSLLCGLGTGGQMLRVPNKAEIDSRTGVVISFTQQGQLRLIDNNADANISFHVTENIFEDRPELLDLGIDPIDNPVTWGEFAYRLHSHKLKLKTLLTDQTFLVGIGPMYADEILFEAGLRFDRISDSLTTNEVRRLWQSMVQTLYDAVKYGGSSVEGSFYLGVNGQLGSFQDHHSVYGKHGELSPRSRKPIARSKFGGEWTYYCEQSQV